MRKKFLAMYALAGALVASPIFTSCIDDTESESVTAVRNAKAEQQRIANQIDAAKAELQMQYDKLKLEADIANQQGLLLGYQLTLKQKQQALDRYGVTILSELTSDYTTALSNVATSEFAILKYNNEIKKLESGYQNAVKTINSTIKTKNTEIEGKQAAIEELKKMQEDGRVDPAVLNAKLDELSNTLNKTAEELTLVNAEYGSISLEKDVEAESWDDADNDGVEDSGEITTVMVYANTKLATIEAARALNELAETLNTANPAPAYQYNFFTWDENNYMVLLEGPVARYKQSDDYTSPEEAAKNIEDMKAALGTDKDTETTKVSEEAGADLTLYAKLAVANKALADAKKAVADAGDAATQDQINAVATQEVAVADAKDAIKMQLIAIANTEAFTDNFDELIAAFSGEDYETYKKAVDAIGAALEANQLASNEYSAMYYLKEDLNFDQNNEEATFEELIAEKEAEIDALKKEIAEMKAIYNNYNYNSNGSMNLDEEAVAAFIAYFENQIAAEEYKLAAYKKAAEEAKAALDAYLGTEEAA